MTATGLPLNDMLPYGRVDQSNAFLSTPGIDRLYSGVAMRTPSTSTMARLKSDAVLKFLGHDPARAQRARRTAMRPAADLFPRMNLPAPHP